MIPLFIGVALHAMAPDASPKTPDYIAEAQKRWADVADVTVVSTWCGEQNAAYYPGFRLVEMCAELYVDRDLALAIFNHEMGHALMHQHGIPNSERGADEISLLTSTPAQLMAAARWFMGMAGESHDPNDPHQSALDRAASIVCYLDGTDEHPVSRACVNYAESISENWQRMLLMVFQPE